MYKIACTQKKLNYTVIIDECKVRIRWCVENVKVSTNDMQLNNFNNIEWRIDEKNYF